ncbi:hypothetical protein [Pontiella sulfatireligans]|uniref:DUF4350 domain-containing protein n=1 Tax=Pontiella sulfatireligans TaxID=2750658 RepID=A0A6C2UI17_9BACT|nr:hypothetical protein [Pontiella sulfatireligans]VGO18974.1 hypothetical protein SCARR_01028 [Pontiella sulfatireligans]
MRFFVLFSSIIGFSACVCAQQMGDPDFKPRLAAPTYTEGKGPFVVIDGAHFNFHKAEERYKPFAELLRADGCRIGSNAEAFSRGMLDFVDILVVANALHPSNDRNWKLPTPSAFSAVEIVAVNEWVKAGGSLMLIADHMPFAGAARDLAETFGFQFNNGFAFGLEKSGGMQFDRETATLQDHEITNGSQPAERIDHVMTFTGQAFSAPPAAAPLLVFGEGCYSLMPQKAWKFDETTPQVPVEGWLQGAALEYGKGRVCVFGEAAGFTAQVSGGQARKTGMNADGAEQNAQFVLNVLHWLSAPLAYDSTIPVAQGKPEADDSAETLPKGYHQFHDQEGRAVVAKVLECDPRYGTVKLRLENGRSKQVKVSIFSGVDREYLKQWIDAQELLSKRFAIAVEPKVTEREENQYATNRASGEKRLFRISTFQDTVQQISLANQTGTPLENIQVEWCVYYQQEKRMPRRPGDSGPSENEWQDRCEKGRSWVALIDSAATKVVGTGQYAIVNTKLVREMSNPLPGMEQEGRTVGIWIKLSIALPDGDEVVRQYCEPESIRKLGWKL